MPSSARKLIVKLEILYGPVLPSQGHCLAMLDYERRSGVLNILRPNFRIVQQPLAMTSRLDVFQRSPCILALLLIIPAKQCDQLRGRTPMLLTQVTSLVPTYHRRSQTFVKGGLAFHRLVVYRRHTTRHGRVGPGGWGPCAPKKILNSGIYFLHSWWHLEGILMIIFACFHAESPHLAIYTERKRSG